MVFLGCSLHLAGQDPCSDPILLNSILISNTTCGNASGNIIISPSGGNSDFSYTWTPAVSNSNIGSNLVAGTYNVHMVRNSNPNCMLDTIIVVNNSNGPPVQATIDPADCFASNGSVSMSPGNLGYNWSNGATTNSVQGLPSGIYYVTATNLNTGCYSVNKIIVPASFDFQASVVILDHAKCGQSTGKAQILVTQGSGQYSYSLGPGPVFSGLAAATYTCVVTDDMTGCTSAVVFSITDLPVTGEVDLSTHDVRCAGDASGSVEFEVVPGTNFELPFVFTLVNANGVPQSPGSLAAGTYYLQISDADLCSLTPDTFLIQQPPPITVTPLVSPETCSAGGAISLQITGGIGAYSVNWLDIPGNINPTNRSNLEAGLYSVLVFDSLFCSEEIDDLLVAPMCNNSDTVFMVLKTSTTDVFCWKKPIGLASNATTFSLLGGGASGSSPYGNWSLDNDGCLAYSAGSVAGFAVDTVCMVRTASQIGLQDTLCLIVTITSKQATKQSVFFTVQTGQSAAACGSIPAPFANYIIRQIGRPGFSGLSDVYGQYGINSSNGCIDFMANNIAGFSVDEIRVAVFDTVLNESHIICYVPSVIPAVDCSAFIQLPDSIPLFTMDCNGMASACLPIPYDNIANYSISDNGALYNAGYIGCAPENTQSYNVLALPSGGGPYQLTDWSVNGQFYSGNFLSITDLVVLMNQLDPNQGWQLQGTGFFRSSNLSATYGSLKLRSFSGVLVTYEPMLQQAFFGAELLFSPGLHQVVFINDLTGCADTASVAVDCNDCQPIHPYVLDAQGNVLWNTTGGCATDTVFCTNIPESEFGNYVITDNQSQFIEYTNCGNMVAMVLDTGLHLLHFENTVTSCAYDVLFYLDCQTLVAGDTLAITLAIGEEQTICLDTALLGGMISSLSNTCGNDGGFTLFDFSFDLNQWCVTITGLSIGEGNLCLELCNAANQCTSYLIHVTVSGAITDSLLAVPDHVFTVINTDVELPILANDIVNGIKGNRFALANIEFLTQPNLGTFGFNQITGFLIYSPNQGVCGVDSFLYRITDTLGQQSTAAITITITCDKVLVFNGISPNGDGRNDTWHILGIEQFPSNEVRVFNRWGNQVFEQKGYNNANAWDGSWNGKALPDGTYFYIVHLGGAAGRLDGYLQILR